MRVGNLGAALRSTYGCATDRVPLSLVALTVVEDGLFQRSGQRPTSGRGTQVIGRRGLTQAVLVMMASVTGAPMA